MLEKGKWDSPSFSHLRNIRRPPRLTDKTCERQGNSSTGRGGDIRHGPGNLKAPGNPIAHCRVHKTTARPSNTIEHHAISMYSVSCPLRFVYWNTYAVFIVYAATAATTTPPPLGAPPAPARRFFFLFARYPNLNIITALGFPAVLSCQRRSPGS